jgi:LAGLIDADG DNA endonuclease family
MKKRLKKKKEREAFIINEYLKEILVGLLLVDLYGRQKSAYAMFVFKQGLKNQDYLHHLYSIFNEYSASAPKSTTSLPNPKTGKCYTSFIFYTYSLLCFNDIYNMFYISGKKVIPVNIFDLLTPIRRVGLAYWIADDGSWNKVNKYVTLCTDSFTLVEVQQLIEVLNTKFNLRCYKTKSGNNFRIIIPSYSIPTLRLRELLYSHIPPMMKYKIGL